LHPSLDPKIFNIWILDQFEHSLEFISNSFEKGVCPDTVNTLKDMTHLRAPTARGEGGIGVGWVGYGDITNNSNSQKSVCQAAPESVFSKLPGSWGGRKSPVEIHDFTIFTILTHVPVCKRY
jgi:hypothetical protein